MLLHEHLYVEGDEECIRLDEHSLRVRTDDDEVELAYFFLDDDVVATAPGRLAYPLYDPWPLPDRPDTRPQPFTPTVPVTRVPPTVGGGATTYAVFLTFYDGESMARVRPLTFPGVGLPALVGYLRDTATPAGDDWPPELLVLRALIAPGEDTIGPGLQRCNRWPGFNLNAEPWPDLPVEHDAAHRRAMEMVAAAEYIDGRCPEASLLQVGDRLAQLAMHCSEPFGYQQWYLFDDTWAATHPNLAHSLLRCANQWGPLDD